MTWQQQLKLTIWLSFPAILAQFSSVLMQYIDASMVGRLGANESASIGLVSTTIWLFGGLASTVCSGFSVQVAHSIGANDYQKARNIARQSLLSTVLFGILLCIIGTSISGGLPVWLGGNKDITGLASEYFFIYALCLPVMEINYMSGAVLRCSGNMKVPSMLNIMMCVMDVVFNFLLIFPTHHFDIAGMSIVIPGAGLGVVGAALGTAIAVFITAMSKLYFLCFRSGNLSLMKHHHDNFKYNFRFLKTAAKISAPMSCERIVMCGAQIASTLIVAPLGTIAIAANSFGITAESLCYMPGYGISEAATTLIGQSLGAGRRELTSRFSRITVLMGIGVMSLMGVVLYVCAPYMMQLMTPHSEIVSLGVDALRIEAFAEPMFAASIVCYGIFVGAGDTFVPACMNLFSIWAVRLTLAWFLAPSMGLLGVWTAMCIELCFRGVIFLLRLKFGKWQRKLV